MRLWDTLGLHVEAAGGKKRAREAPEVHPAEIVKHAIINDKKFYFWLKRNFKNIFRLDKNKSISFPVKCS